MALVGPHTYRHKVPPRRPAHNRPTHHCARCRPSPPEEVPRTVPGREPPELRLADGVTHNETVLCYRPHGGRRSPARLRDAATGEILAESDFFEPLSINGLTPPGFGGRIYFPTAVGKGFYVLQAGPKQASP